VALVALWPGPTDLQQKPLVAYGFVGGMAKRALYSKKPQVKSPPGNKIDPIEKKHTKFLNFKKFSAKTRFFDGAKGVGKTCWP